LSFVEVEADVLNKGKHWTAAEDEVLKQKILMGASLREISKELNRTERSVRSRASTLRLLLRSFGAKRAGVRKYG
jgi:DNA-directed RNA polymerase specialized sigma24 family protein